MWLRIAIALEYVLFKNVFILGINVYVFLYILDVVRVCLV